MGKKLHVDQVRRFARTTPVFTAGDIVRLVGDRNYALLMLHNMTKKGELTRVSRGFYSIHVDPTMSVFAFRPAYLGLQDALSVRGLWEQQTNVVVVTMSKAKPGVRSVNGSNVVVHRIDPRYFFGFDYQPYHGDLYVPVSDLEKTLIDLVYFRETPGSSILRELARAANKKVVTRYLNRYPEAFRKSFQRQVLEGK